MKNCPFYGFQFPSLLLNAILLARNGNQCALEGGDKTCSMEKEFGLSPHWGQCRILPQKEKEKLISTLKKGTIVMSPHFSKEEVGDPLGELPFREWFTKTIGDGANEGLDEKMEANCYEAQRRYELSSRR